LKLVAAACTVKVVVCMAPPESDGGAKLQIHPAGSPEQPNDTAAENPFCGATVTLSAAGCVEVTVAAVVDRLNV
jgi:hypothetical protein